MNEAQLLDDRGREHERVEIGSAHRPIDAVHGDDERRPSVDDLIDRAQDVGVEVEPRRMGAVPVDRRLDPEPERARRLERIDDMEIVGPGLGEILPRMRSCVSRDEAPRPIGGSALLVVALKRRLVVLRIVSERRAALFESAAVAHKDVPIMMADFVTKMTKQAAIRLGQFRPALFHRRAVGFGKRDRDHSVVMPGHHPGAGRIGRIGEEFERQAVDRVLRAGLERQFPAKQAIEEAVLGEFDVPRGGKMQRLGDVGNRLVMPAGDAQPIPAPVGGQPVADVIVRIGAEAAQGALARQGRPAIAARGFERRHDFEFGDIGEPMAAAAAGPILKINDVVAGLAPEQFHGRRPRKR
jgi:hypothetical protein